MQTWAVVHLRGLGSWEAPIQDGGHVCCRVEFAASGGYVQVEERVLPVSTLRM
jgi:hypothetical protein